MNESLSPGARAAHILWFHFHACNSGFYRSDSRDVLVLIHSKLKQGFEKKKNTKDPLKYV